MRYRLSEVGRIVTGKTPSTKNSIAFSDKADKYLFVTPRDMNISAKIIGVTERYLTDEVTDQFKNLILDINSICVSCIGTVGKVFMVNKPAITNQQINSITDTKKNICVPDFLYYYLSIHQKDIENLAGGTTMPIVNKTAFESLIIDLPDLETQQKIVRILSALDSKIELNNQQNQTLELILDKLYDENFINKCDNDWTEYSLEELLDYKGGYSYTSKELVETSNTGMMTIKNFERNGGFKIDGFKPLLPQKNRVPLIEPLDILIACTDVTQNADIIGNAVLVLNKNGYENITFSMDLVKIIPKNINKFILYMILKSKEFKGFALGYKSGTTVLHLNKKCLKEFKIQLPKEKEMEKFAEIVEATYKKIATNIKNSQELEKIRNILLPKLMNGGINLTDINL